MLFAVGAISGTIISFELGLLFPRFIAFAGGVIGLPFSLEAFAFFVEAIFVGLYLYGWNRLSPRLHWLSGFPVALSAVASAFFIVTANAWINLPRGFHLSHGYVTHVDPLAAIFNPAWATETSHMILGAYLATAFGVASVYAVGMLRGRRDAYHRRGLAIGLALAVLIVAPRFRALHASAMADIFATRFPNLFVRVGFALTLIVCGLALAAPGTPKCSPTSDSRH